MFQVKTVELGNIKADVKYVATFKATDDVTNVTIIPPSCDCTKPIWDELNKEVRITYTPKKVSKELILIGVKHYNTTKQICVKYNLEGKERTEFLTITGTVTN